MGKDKVFNNIGAAILAGGKNSRMSGFNKAFIEINGVPIIERLIKILRGIFDEVIIATNSPEEFKSFEKETMIITDIIKNVGPLAGIHAALSTSKKEAVFFVACDMPFLHNDLILRQLKDFENADSECLVPRIGSSIEPLHAVYKKALKDNINSFVKEGEDYSIRGFLETIDVCFWDLKNSRLNKGIFKNLNTKEDLKKVKACLPAGRGHYACKI